jgi:dephospho-CoA kinase
MKRDQINREQVLARISKQITQEEKEKMSDFVIYNDGERSVIRQVMTMHQSLIS